MLVSVVPSRPAVGEVQLAAVLGRFTGLSGPGHGSMLAFVGLTRGKPGLRCSARGINHPHAIDVEIRAGPGEAGPRVNWRIH